MMVMAAPTHGFGQILDVGELAALRRVGEVRRKLVELIRGCSVAIQGSGLSGILQVGGDLLRDLLILDRVRLLDLLECAQQLCER